jgi:ankyrin repeat protein
MRQFLLPLIATLLFTGCSPELNRAVKSGNTDRVRQLLDSGGDVNVRDSSTERLQYTPLHWAAYYDHQEIAELLISRGADLDAQDPWDSTPLYLAAEQGHIEIVELLIAEGAEVNVKSKRWGYTPLHRAAWGPVVRPLSERSENSGSAPNTSYTEIVDLLIAQGAEINARDNDGQTALDQATWSDNVVTVALLRKHGGKHGAMHYAAYGGDVRAVNGFLTHGVDVNAKGGSIMGTPLHYAAQGGHTDVVQLLLSKGADVNMGIEVEGGSFNGKTPLDRANSFNHAQIADLLRKHDGKTAKELKTEAEATKK